jgi:ABC-type transporter Mla subunit MlaD
MAARLVLNAALDSESGSDSGSDSSGGSDSGSSGSDSSDSGSSGSDSFGSSDSGSSGSGSSGGSDSSGSDAENSGGSSGTPDNGSGTPDGGTGTPDGGSGTPDGGTGTPDGGSGTPDGGTGTPDGGTGTPDGGTPPTPGKPPENNTVGGAVVDLITNGLDSASARIDQIQYELTAALNQLKYPTSAVIGDLADLCAELGVLTNSLSDAGYLMGSLGESAGTLREILADVDALRTVLNDYEPTLQEALANTGALSTSAAATIRDTETLLADAENLARSTGKDLDAGTRQSLRGLSAALRQTAKALATTKQVKEAKNTVTQIIEDTWNEYTGDVNNLLLMDAGAEAVSLTDRRNPSPTSVQVLIRTQEIQEADPAETEEPAAVKPATTFWERIAQMFQDFWSTLTGVFH